MLIAVPAFAQDTPAQGYIDIVTALVIARNLVDRERIDIQIVKAMLERSGL